MCHEQGWQENISQGKGLDACFSQPQTYMAPDVPKTQVLPQVQSNVLFAFPKEVSSDIPPPSNEIETGLTGRELNKQHCNALRMQEAKF